MTAKSQELTAGRDAPLYHWVGWDKAVSMLRSDSLIPKFMHKKTNVKGVSLTRNSRYAHDWAGHNPIRLEFDQRLLAQRFKIEPLDAEYHAYFDRMRRDNKDYVNNVTRFGTGLSYKYTTRRRAVSYNFDSVY